MLAFVTVVVATASVPTPSQALLASAHPVSWTRQLLAQAADRDAEVEALEEDMERSRERLGHPKAVEQKVEPAPAATPAPRSTRMRPDPRYRPTYEGHTRGYYLTWGIVDWVLAGQLWGVAAYTGLVAMFASALSVDHDNVGMFAIIYGAIALGSGAGGGIAAWRAVTNIRIYRDLKHEEQAHRSGRLPGPRR